MSTLAQPAATRVPGIGNTEMRRRIWAIVGSPPRSSGRGAGAFRSESARWRR